jgi:hypothetical protein
MILFRYAEKITYTVLALFCYDSRAFTNSIISKYFNVSHILDVVPLSLQRKTSAVIFCYPPSTSHTHPFLSKSAVPPICCQGVRSLLIPSIESANTQIIMTSQPPTRHLSIGQPPEAILNAFFILPKVTSVLSLIGSSIILRDVIKRRGTRKYSPRHRLLAGMSVCDLMASTAMFLTSWPIPKDYLWPTQWSVGNQATCTAQGFFSQMALGTNAYNCCLAIYYLLTIRQGWSDEKISKRAEPIMHIVSFGFALGTGVSGLGLTLFNPNGVQCWIAPSPRGCIESYKARQLELPTNPYPCQRGDNALIYNMAFVFGPVWLSFLIMITSLLLIYCRIRNLNLATARYHREGQQIQRRFATQATLYVLAWFLSWSVVSSLYIRFWITPVPSFWHGFVSSTLVPLQGFWNMLVFRYPEHSAWWDKKKRALRESSGEDNVSNERWTSSILSRLPFRRECCEKNVAGDVEGMNEGEERQENQDMLGSNRENTSDPNARETEEMNGLEWVSEKSTEEVLDA